MLLKYYTNYTDVLFQDKSNFIFKSNRLLSYYTNLHLILPLKQKVLFVLKWRIGMHELNKFFYLSLL